MTNRHKITLLMFALGMVAGVFYIAWREAKRDTTPSEGVMYTAEPTEEPSIVPAGAGQDKG